MFRDTDNLNTLKPYVKRALEDDNIQKNVLSAFQSARRVYSDLSGEDGAKSAAKRFSSDSGVRDDLDSAIHHLSEAVLRLNGEEKRARKMQKEYKDESTSWAPFLVVAGVVFALFNPATGASTRKWLKDHLLGSEEEFDYPQPRY